MVAFGQELKYLRSTSLVETSVQPQLPDYVQGVSTWKRAVLALLEHCLAMFAELDLAFSRDGKYAMRWRN